MARSLSDVAAGHGTLYLVGGEPGIGKTRLAESVVTEARRQGFLAVWGHCWEDGGTPPYWPWVQVLRGWMRERSIEDLRNEVRATSLGAIATILPELTDLAPDVPTIDLDRSEQGRFVLFDAISAFLRAAARREPLLVVLDDVHAADDDSLRLLQYVARDLPSGRILVVVTYREEEVSRRDAGILLADLGRKAHNLPLRGLSEEEVAAYVEHVTGVPPSALLTQSLHLATLGNPFFVDAVLHVLSAERRLQVTAIEGELGVPIPPSVRDAIQRRLRNLPDEVRRTLRVAAAMGRTFTLRMLAELLDLPVPSVLEHLEVPLAWGIVGHEAGVGGRYAFSHMLVRDTLYGELDPEERFRLHERVGRALEESHADALAGHLAEIAHHYLLAAPAVGADRAVEYATLAGEQAMVQTAYEDAASLFARALETIEVAGEPNDQGRCHLLLSLGSARTRAGDTVEGRQTFLRAAELARHLHASDRLAAAAIGYAGVTGFHFTGRVNPTLVSLLQEALDALPSDDRPERVRLLARLGVALYWSDEPERRIDLSEEAVAVAERLGDPDTLAMALHSRRYAQWTADNLDARLRDGRRALELALEAGNLELAASAHRWRLTDLLEQGDIGAVDRELGAHDRLVDQLRQPFHRSHTAQFHALRAVMQGRYEEGESWARQASAQAERAGSSLALSFLGMQLFPAWRQQARVEDLSDVVAAAYEQAPPQPAATSGLALLSLSIGQRDRAAILLDLVARANFDDLRRDMLFLETLALAAPVCAELGDRGRAARAYELLAPFAGRVVVSGAPARACWGPVDHHLGVLAATCGEVDRADAHFAAAEALGLRLGSPPLVADTRFEHGRVLLAGGEPARHERARGLLAQAAASAQALGMSRIAAAVAALEDDAATGDAAVPGVRRAEALPSGDAVPEEPAVTAGAGNPVVTLRREGDTWAVVGPRGVVRVRDMKGLRHLEYLLASPGREHHVLDLTAAVEGTVGVRGGGVVGDDGDPSPRAVDGHEVLDRRAREEYRHRLEDLEGDLEEARSFHDTGRVAVLEEERQFLLDELAAAVGLGGRVRRTNSDAERARVNVTRAIRSAIRRVAEHDVELADQLDRSVETGTYCVYRPISRDR